MHVHASVSATALMIMFRREDAHAATYMRRRPSRALWLNTNSFQNRELVQVIHVGSLSRQPKPHALNYFFVFTKNRLKARNWQSVNCAEVKCNSFAKKGITRMLYLVLSH